MAKQLQHLDERLVTFIKAQKVFFVATAAPDARINLSPKGHDALRVLGPNRVIYLDVTGSGSETSAHLKADGRMTIMFSAFEGPPMILRLYGRARSVLAGEAEYAALIDAHFAGHALPGSRQIVDLTFDLVQTSCGYAVPLFDYVEDRTALVEWAERKGADGLKDYRAEKNRLSLDGLATGMV